jgi:transposase
MTRTLLSMNYSHRRLSRISHKANTFQRVAFREKARDWVASLDQLVFLDETSKNRASINRQYGWGPRRKTIFNKSFVLRGKRMSVVGAYSLNGLITFDLTSNTYNRDRFEDFFQHFLLPELTPYPGPRSIVILDNARIHNRRNLFNMCLSRGAILLFMSPYSPDMYPIQKFWALVKIHLKQDWWLSSR